MRTEKSRRYLTYVVLAAALAFGTVEVAAADELQFDLTGTAYTSTGASAGLFDISFMLDTKSGTISTGFYDQNLPQDPYQNVFIVTAATYSNVNFIVDGTSIFSAPQAEGSYTLTTFPFGGNTFLPDNTAPTLEWHFAPMPTYMSQQTYNALSDPLATVFLSYQDAFNGLGTIFTEFTDPADTHLDLVFASETVRDVTPTPPPVGVPEPGILGLMLIGFGGLWLHASRARNNARRGPLQR